VEDTEQQSGTQAAGARGQESATAALLREYPDNSKDVFMNFLKNRRPLTPPPDMDKYREYPALFDVNGGAKRRAMREEEDLRLHGDQEDATEGRAPSVGEPEAGGSLALGGEPEERDGNENHGFDQRRPGTQPPIQRGNTEGPFGPAVGASNFGQASSNPVGRTITPQQLFPMRSQSGFGDQMPPGITSQNNMFQGQGHSRQSSRFSFANEGGNSATNVKVAGNPRIMAQQSSMMPSSLQSQAGNQYFATSMPGPPPGLKSTGTPPGMFGQAGFSGSGFGVPPKESNELLQTLMGRNSRSNIQAHDAGKLDLADPSILQARMQHQSQSNAGSGHGLFGGQSQGGYNPNMMYNAGYSRW